MLQQALWFVGLMVGVLALVQILLWAAPGDPIDLLGAEAIRAELEAEWGLDRPLPARIAASVQGVLHGDLGHSLTVRPGAAVWDLAAQAGARSARLLFPATLLSLLLSLLLAWSGRWRRLLQAVSVVPIFLMAHVLVFSLNEVTFSLIESGRIIRPDWFALPLNDTPARSLLAIAILAISSGALSGLTGELAHTLHHIRGSAWLEAARARGTWLLPHVLGNLMPPLLVSLASQIAYLTGGLIIVEKVLLLNGAGALLWEASLQRDYPLAMGLALLAAVVVCSARLLANLARVLIDPRLRMPR